MRQISCIKTLKTGLLKALVDSLDISEGNPFPRAVGGPCESPQHTAKDRPGKPLIPAVNLREGKYFGRRRLDPTFPDLSLQLYHRPLEGIRALQQKRVPELAQGVGGDRQAGSQAAFVRHLHRRLNDLHD